MENLHVSVAPEVLFHLGPLPVTNSFLTMLIVMALLLIVGASLARRAQLVPGRAQGSFELIVEFLLGLVESTAGREAGRRIFPLVGGVFIFIAFANYVGVLPGVGSIGFYETPAGSEGTTGSEHAGVAREVASIAAIPAAPAVAAVPAKAEEGAPALVPFLRAPNADLNMTLALALVTFTIVQIAGISTHGVAGRIKHMADPPFLFPIELISELSRIISLSARLFGNVFAGEVLLAVMYALAVAVKVAVIPLAVPVVFIGLELLFGTIQALVFALLTLIYITLATAGHSHAEDEAAHVEGAHGLGNVPAGAAD